MRIILVGNAAALPEISPCACVLSGTAGLEADGCRTPCLHFFPEQLVTGEAGGLGNRKNLLQILYDTQRFKN